jgi:SulP family sulfate permease
MFATAIVESLRRYSAAQLRSDVSAGITVGVVAIPLSMALAIASGVPPQHGLYTAIIAGAIIALCGGSRVNISGPTAAFVVVLLPVVHQFGLGGLVLAGLMSGLILIALGLARMGRLIELVPYPVTVGFTAGIAVVIAVLQIKDFLGLTITEPGENFVARVWAIGAALPTLRWQDTLVAVTTLALLTAWPRLQTRMPPRLRLPGPLVVLALITLVSWVAASVIPGVSIATIGNTFSYSLGDILHEGIPALPPMPIAPWELPGPDGAPIGLSFDLIHKLLGPAMTIAALAAIESLLCAVIADGMAGARHNPNAELIGLGIGNVVVPFFAGIPATAAISRTATSVRAGARTPIAAIVHAAVVLLAVLAIAGLLNQVPMAALAALLLIVAWNMSEARHVLRIVRTAPGSDIAVLLCCFTLTVLFDMTVAVSVGIGLAAMLFIRQVIEQTGVRALGNGSRRRRRRESLPDGVLVYDIDGALFFGAAHRALRALESLPPDARVVVLDMDDVSILDMTAMMLLQELLTHLGSRGAVVIIAGLHPRLILQLRRSGIRRRRGALEFRSDPRSALRRAAVLVAPPESEPTPTDVTASVTEGAAVDSSRTAGADPEEQGRAGDAGEAPGAEQQSEPAPAPPGPSGSRDQS